MNFIEVKKYLDSFINYEKKSFLYPRDLKIERVKFLLENLKIPYQKIKCIHIAGTKGKGSTATFCAYLLSCFYKKVGLYTSPHFFDFRERIQKIERKNKRFKVSLISKKEVIRIVEEIKPILEKIRFTLQFGKISFFEVYTAIAFKYFLENNFEMVVLETGLGGRLDATNVVKPEISILTTIDYDHMDKLGRTLKEIATEKAGIIKENTPCVSAFQRSSVQEIVKKKCSLQKVPLFLQGKDFFIKNIFLKENYSSFDFLNGAFFLKRLKISLKGKMQIENASLALEVLYLLKKQKILEKIKEIREALFASYLPGRFEVLKNKFIFVLDVAHNPCAFLVLSENLKVYFPKKKIIFIFSAARDKDVKNMLNKIKYQHLILTKFNNPRTFLPEEIKKVCKLENVFLAKDIKEALKIAYHLYRKDNLILISGSLFLVSEAKKYLDV